MFVTINVLTITRQLLTDHDYSDDDDDDDDSVFNLEYIHNILWSMWTYKMYFVSPIEQYR